MGLGVLVGGWSSPLPPPTGPYTPSEYPGEGDAFESKRGPSESQAAGLLSPEQPGSPDRRAQRRSFRRSFRAMSAAIEGPGGKGSCFG